MPSREECVAQYGEKYMGRFKKKERAKLGAREAGEGFVDWLKRKKDIELEVSDGQLGYLGFALFACSPVEDTIEVLEQVTVRKRDYGDGHKH